MDLSHHGLPVLQELKTLREQAVALLAVLQQIIVIQGLPLDKPENPKDAHKGMQLWALVQLVFQLTLQNALQGLKLELHLGGGVGQVEQQKAALRGHCPNHCGVNLANTFFVRFHHIIRDSEANLFVYHL